MTMDNQDAQSVTQEDRDLDWLDKFGRSPYCTCEDNDIIQRVVKAARHRLASQPTSAEDAEPAGWQHRIRARREGAEWSNWRDGKAPNLIPWSEAEERALYSRPTPDTQTAAIGAEAMREALEIVNRIPFSEFPGKTYKERVANCETVVAALSQPVAAPQAEMAGGETRYRRALEAIKQAVIDGYVCDDVAWFDKITTLHDFIDMVLDPPEPPVFADLFSTPPQPEGGTVETIARVLAIDEYADRHGIDEQAEKIAGTDHFENWFEQSRSSFERPARTILAALTPEKGK